MKRLIQSLCFLLVFLTYSQPNSEVFLFDLNTKDDSFELSNINNISNNDGYDNQPSFWDNTTILYAGTRNGQTDIVKYTIEDGSHEWLSDTEGSEYSPLKIPDHNTVSAIRLDTDGTQKLYGYDLSRPEFGLLVGDIVIGYYVWTNTNILVSSVLNDTNLDLYVSDLIMEKNKKLADNVGRSLHVIPNTDLVSFISKESNNLWKIKSINPLTGVTKTIIQTLPQIEDMCWTPNGSILMAKDGVLYQYNPNKSENWTKAVSLTDFGINNITRLAVSPDGTKLAVVCELINQKLEPKLENIKWIAGNWKGEAFGGLTEENWSKPSGGSMMATFKLIDKGEIAFYEIEIIREVENSLILQLKHFDNDLKGWESKDETVDFPLREITANKVIFEGMTFERVSDNEMNVYVDIHQENGEIETVQFNYKK